MQILVFETNLTQETGIPGGGEGVHTAAGPRWKRNTLPPPPHHALWLLWLHNWGCLQRGEWGWAGSDLALLPSPDPLFNPNKVAGVGVGGQIASSNRSEMILSLQLFPGQGAAASKMRSRWHILQDRHWPSHEGFTSQNMLTPTMKSPRQFGNCSEKLSKWSTHTLIHSKGRKSCVYFALT